MVRRRVLALLILVIVSLSCQNISGLGESSGFAGSGTLSKPGVISPTPSWQLQTPGPTPFPEQIVQQITLNGPLSEAQAEVSGMAWDGNSLILMPQFPGQYASPGIDGLLFALEKADILAYLAGDRSEPLQPRPIPLVAPGLARQIPGFEGFEAIAVDGDSVYLTIESSNGQPMMGYLIRGRIEENLSRILLDPASLIPLPPRAKLFNKTDEALVLANAKIYSIYEANGAEINPNPVAYRFNLPDLNNMALVPFPHLEFRVTDATPADSQGRFWAINTFWPVDLGVATDVDPLAQKFGEGATHGEFLTVERLVELQIEQDRITLTETPPIQLSLIDDFSARNWEGLARLNNLGFLLMTDQHPASIFAFVPLP
jgi:hypothetical protein